MLFLWFPHKYASFAFELANDGFGGWVIDAHESGGPVYAFLFFDDKAYEFFSLLNESWVT